MTFSLPAVSPGQTVAPRQPSLLAPTELSAARLDGELYQLYEQYSPIDLPDFPAERAAVLLRLLPAQAVAERLSAAWLHGATDEPPRRHQFVLPRGGRAPAQHGRHPAFTLRRGSFTAGELTMIGGCPVTTAERTVADLLCDARLGAAEADRLAAAVAATAELAPVDRSAIRR